MYKLILSLLLAGTSFTAAGEDVHFSMAILPPPFWLSSQPTMAVEATVPPGADEITVTLATSAIGKQTVVTRQTGDLCRVNDATGVFNGGIQAACFEPWSAIDAPTSGPTFDYVLVTVRRGTITSSKRVESPQVPGAY